MGDSISGCNLSQSFGNSVDLSAIVYCQRWLADRPTYSSLVHIWTALGQVACEAIMHSGQVYSRNSWHACTGSLAPCAPCHLVVIPTSKRNRFFTGKSQKQAFAQSAHDSRTSLVQASKDTVLQVNSWQSESATQWRCVNSTPSWKVTMQKVTYFLASCRR